MKNLLTTSLLCLTSFAVYSAEYTPEDSLRVSKAINKSLEKIVFERQEIALEKIFSVRGKSEKNLPCLIVASISAETVQISVLETEKDSDLDLNGIPTTRWAQFKWQDYRANYKTQKLNSFSETPDTVVVDFKYRDYSGVMGHFGDSVTKISYNKQEGLLGIYAKEKRGLFSSNEKYTVSCTGPWSKLINQE